MAQPKNINNAILDVLSSIDQKMGAQEKQSQKLNTNLEGMASAGAVSQKEYESFAKLWGILGKGIASLVKSLNKVNKKTGEKFKKLVIDIGTGIKEFFEHTNEAQVLVFTKMIEGLGVGIGKYALIMFLALPLLLVAPIGAALFGLSIRVMMLAIGIGGMQGGKKLAAMKIILDMAKGIILFALAMLVVTVLAPAMILGAVVFGLTNRILFMILFGGNTAADFKTLFAMSIILDMAKGIMLFGLAMVVVTLLAPFMLIGALVFGLSVRLLLLAMGATSIKKMIGMYLILQMAKGALLFVLAMALIFLLASVFVPGVLLFAAAVFLLLLVARIAGSPKSLKGILGMVILSFVVLLYALIFPYFDSVVTWGALLKVGVALGGTAFLIFLVGKIAKDVFKGVIALGAAAVVVMIFSIALLIWKSANVEWMDLAKLGATIGAMALIGLIAGLGPVPGFILAGSAALIVAGGAVIVMALGMAIWTAAKVTWTDVGTLGATIAMIGVEMGLLGLASPFIFAGAAAMAFASIPLIAITGSLAVFKASKWQAKDGDMLINALDSVVAGFLGGRMPGGFFAAIKFAAKAAARAALLFVTVPPFLLAGAALVPITWSLKTFKEAKWTPKDSANMEGVMAAIIRAFALPSDYDRQKQMGFYVSPWRLMMGIFALRNAGDTMASLAQGIQAFANLTVPIYSWVEKEGGGSLEITERRQMTEGDFKKAAYGMAITISAISKPFAEVGKLEEGSRTGNAILDAIFAGNYVSKGVSALKNSGEIIVGLADGVRSFAELTIPEYGLVDYTDENGNTNKKLMVVGRKPMGPGDIATASFNISMVIGVIAKALAKVGKMEADSEGWFSDGYVTKGAAALAGVGDNIKAIADVVANYAKLEFTPMEVVGKGTKDQKLVPGTPIKITKGQIMEAAYTITDVLGVMVDKMAYIGEMESKGGWFFKNNYVKKGVAAIAGLGANIGAIADAVFKFATGTFTPMMMNNKGELVPSGPPQRVGRPQIMEAASIIKDLIWSFGRGFHSFGEWAAAGVGTKYIDLTIDLMGSMSDGVNKLTGMVTKLVKNPAEKYKEAMSDVEYIFGTFKNMFDPQNNPNVMMQSIYFTMWANNMMTIGKYARDIIDAGRGFNSMATATKVYVAAINQLDGKKANQGRWLIESMTEPNAWKGAKSISISTVRLKEQINGLDMDRLKILNSLMCALAKLGSTDVGLDRLGEELGEGMKEGFELLAEYLAELLEQGKGGGGSQGGVGVDSNPFIGGGGDTAPGGAAPAGQPAAASGGGDMSAQLKKALQSVVLTVRSSNQGGDQISF